MCHQSLLGKRTQTAGKSRADELRAGTGTPAFLSQGPMAGGLDLGGPDIQRTSGGAGVGLQLNHGGSIAMRVPRETLRVNLGPGDSKSCHFR